MIGRTRTKRVFLTATLFSMIAGGSWVFAQAPTKAAPVGVKSAAGEHGGAGGMPGHNHGKGPEHGKGAGMHEGGMCPMMMVDPNTKIEVTKIDKGVTITLTSADAATVARIQKMAESMRVMHESGKAP